MRQCGDLGVPKNCDSVFIHSVLAHLLGMLLSLLGMLKSSPGALLSGFVVLLLMGFRSTTMGVGRTIVQLRSPLMVFVM